MTGTGSNFPTTAHLRCYNFLPLPWLTSVFQTNKLVVFDPHHLHPTSKPDYDSFDNFFFPLLFSICKFDLDLEVVSVEATFILLTSDLQLAIFGLLGQEWFVIYLLSSSHHQEGVDVPPIPVFALGMLIFPTSWAKWNRICTEIITDFLRDPICIIWLILFTLFILTPLKIISFYMNTLTVTIKWEKQNKTKTHIPKKKKKCAWSRL